MKNLICLMFMTFGLAFGAHASGTPKTSKTKTADSKNKKTAVVAQRVSHLCDQMIRDLRLNNYQSNEVREINNDIISKVVAIETEFEGNQELIDQKVKEVLLERDQKLESVLSTVQYNKYYGKRVAFNKADKEFVANVNNSDSGNADAMTAVDNTADAVTNN